MRSSINRQNYPGGWDDHHHPNDELQHHQGRKSNHYHRSPHFIAGIGDGNHHEYDLPDPDRSFVRKKKEMEEIYNRHHRSKNHEEQHQRNHQKQHQHHPDNDHNRANGNDIVLVNDGDNRQHQHLHPPTPPSSYSYSPPLSQTHHEQDFEPLSHQIQNNNGFQTSFIAILSMISVIITISYFVGDYYSKKNVTNNREAKSKPSSPPKQQKQQQSNSMLDSITSSLLSLSLSSITSLTTKGRTRSRNTKLQIPVITGMRRTDSSIVRTKKKKTDEWNEDDEEDCDSSTSSRAGVYGNSNNHSHNQAVQNHFYNPHHHLMDGYYRQEPPRLRKHAASGGANCNSSNNNAASTTSSASSSAAASRPHSAIFQSSSKEYPKDIIQQQQQQAHNRTPIKQQQSSKNQLLGRYTNNNDGAVDIGIGLDGFDAGLSPESEYASGYHSHNDKNIDSNNDQQHNRRSYTDDKNSEDGSTQELKMGTPSAPMAATTTTTTVANSDKDNALTLVKSSDHIQDVISTTSSIEVSDEEWDQLSTRSNCSHASSSLLSASNQSNHSEQSVVHVQHQSQHLNHHSFLNSPTSSFVGGGSKYGHDDDDNNIESSGYLEDEEMPTPRIDNVQQSLRQKRELQAEGASVSSSATWGDFPLPDGIPDLPNLSSMELTTVSSSKENERSHEDNNHNYGVSDTIDPLPPPPIPFHLSSLSPPHPQINQKSIGNSINNDDETIEIEYDQMNDEPDLMDHFVDSNVDTDEVHSFSAKAPAPRSISVEELKLIRMERGVVSQGWDGVNHHRRNSEMNSNSADDNRNNNLDDVVVNTDYNIEHRKKNNGELSLEKDRRPPQKGFKVGQDDTQQTNTTSTKILFSPADCKFTNNEKDGAEKYQRDQVEMNYLAIEEGKNVPPVLKNENTFPNNNEMDKNDEDDDDENDLSPGETEGANGIMHKRKNLTLCTDAASSLTSPIAFSELKMKELIGGGGFGQVWEASWRGTPVAVKILSVSHKAEHIQKAILQEFAAEINMVSGMRHPNICLYIGACLEPSNRAIVTELATNGSLWDALRQPLKPPYFAADGKTRHAWPLSLYESLPETSELQIYASPEFGPPVPFGTSPYVPLSPEGSWPWLLVRKIAEGAARGMNYLHFGNPPVLHRDLKSANILLDDSYNAKVADFGLSRLKAQQRSMTGNCGTVQWMAPEILANESYAEPADVYSYGIILWELLVKECPYGDMSPIQCALAVLGDSRPEIPDWCPPLFRDLILRCMAKDPSKRPTFSEIIAILDKLR